VINRSVLKYTWPILQNLTDTTRSGVQQAALGDPKWIFRLKTPLRIYNLNGAE